MIRIQLEHLDKHFGATHVLCDFSLDINPGEFLVLLGPSGCGKTTCLRTVAGLEQPDAGCVLLDDRDVTQLEPRDRDMAMVFQSYALYPHLDVFENIAFPLRVRKLAVSYVERRVKEAAERLGLAALLRRRPRELSGGQRQRVALARAIVRQPNAFLFDEPLSNLDAKLRVEMRAELKRLQHDLGVTSLYVTHDQAEAMTLGRRLAVMKDGVLEQIGPPEEVYSRPANLFVAGFLGNPSMNFFPGRVDAAARAFASEGIAVDLSPEPMARLTDGASVTLGVRPENVELDRQPRDGWIPGRVYVSEAMGNENLVVVRVGEHSLTCRAAPEMQLDFESPVWVRFRPDRLHFFDTSTTKALWP
ncbi:MAG: ABC transporter ATP-binding protein [Acidobacteria bacterium]|nr:ABC transporter ATP-binding protein [Acidobacteriota bacterium]